MKNLITRLSGKLPSEGGATIQHLTIDKHFKRLVEVEEALGEIGQFFAAESSRGRVLLSLEDPLQASVEFIKKVRVPGFIAFNLAQEGLALVNIIAAIAALAKKNGPTSDDLERVECHIDEVELTFRRTLDEMSPYQSLDLSATVEAVAARIAKNRNST